MVINNVRAMNWNMHTIKNLRKYMGKSQVEFSNDLGVRQQTISEWETGVYEPRGGSVTLLNLISSEIGFDTWYSEKINNLRIHQLLHQSYNETSFVQNQPFYKIIEDEESHIYWLETQLDLIDNVGLQNYSQSMM